MKKLLVLLVPFLLTSCEYVRLLRPSVLKQLNPRVVRLVNELPNGWGGWVEGYAPEMYGAPRGTSLMVFALP